MADYDISKITLDSGDVCNLKDKKLGEAVGYAVEDDVALSNHYIGDVGIKGNRAYIAKTNITKGDTLVEGTNITMVTTIGNMIKRLCGDFAAIQEGDTATIKRSVGDYLVMHGTLYKVTAAIAVGDTLTVGTNITAANLGAQLASEVSRAKSAESTLTTNLNSEISRAKSAESTLTTNLNSEISRAKSAESTNASSREWKYAGSVSSDAQNTSAWSSIISKIPSTWQDFLVYVQYPSGGWKVPLFVDKQYATRLKTCNIINGFYYSDSYFLNAACEMIMNDSGTIKTFRLYDSWTTGKNGSTTLSASSLTVQIYYR